MENAFFSVDSRNNADITRLRHIISNYFARKFKHVDLPIQPNWLLFGIILRSECLIIEMNDCLKIGKELQMNEDEVKVCLWYLHYCVGTLIYYPDLPDDSGWFKENVICSPQVVLDSIDKLILRVLHSTEDLPCFNQDRDNWENKGQFSVDALKVCLEAEDSEVLEKVENKELIPIENLVDLLKYINLLSSINSDKQAGVTYLMPAILKCAPQKELITPPAPDLNTPEPVFIKFNCGYIPTGLFCGLITRLVSLSANKIFGMEWELKQSGVKQNCVSFFIHSVNIVTILSHENCCEIRLIRKQEPISLHDLCTHVLSVVLYTLETLYEHISPMIAFKCQCRNIQRLTDYEHLCILKWGTVCAQYLCEKNEVTLSSSQEIWIGKVIGIYSWGKLVCSEQTCMC